MGHKKTPTHENFKYICMYIFVLYYVSVYICICIHIQIFCVHLLKVNRITKFPLLSTFFLSYIPLQLVDFAIFSYGLFFFLYTLRISYMYPMKYDHLPPVSFLQLPCNLSNTPQLQCLASSSFASFF